MTQQERIVEIMRAWRKEVTSDDYDVAARILSEVRGEWVSVEERLPDYWQKVLAVRVKEDGGRLVFEAFLDSRGKWRTYLDPLCAVESITHWMPLPTPPDTEGEK